VKDFLLENRRLLVFAVLFAIAAVVVDALVRAFGIVR
jgi:hypothetical protein